MKLSQYWMKNLPVTLGLMMVVGVVAFFDGVIEGRREIPTSLTSFLTYYPEILVLLFLSALLSLVLAVGDTLTDQSTRKKGGTPDTDKR